MSDIQQLYAQLDKLEPTLEKELGRLCRQDFRCEPDAMQAQRAIAIPYGGKPSESAVSPRSRFAKRLKYHCLEKIEVVQQTHHPKPGRPRKQATPYISYQIRTALVRNQTAISLGDACSSCFVLATNVTNAVERTS